MGNQDHGLDAVASERLLDSLAGRQGGDGHERLAELLAMAAAPASPAELAGEEAAVAVFRAVHVTNVPVTSVPVTDVPATNVPATNVPPPAHRAPRTTWGRRLLTVKTGAVALALAAGGVALATGTGVLPGHQDGTPPPTTAAPASSQATLTGATTSKPADRSATGGAPGSPGIPGSATGQPSASPARSSMLQGLCGAHLARVSRGHEARDTPAFATLAAAAGGAELVTAFCQTLLDHLSAGTSGHSGGNPAHQTGPPSPETGGQPSGSNELGIPHQPGVPAQPDVPTQDPPTP